MRVLQVAGRARGGLAKHVNGLVDGLGPDGFEFRQAEVAGATAGAVLALWRLARRWRPAVLHLHGFRAGVAGRLAAGALGAARPGVVYTVHGWPGPGASALARAGLGWAEGALGGWADRVLVVCEPLRRYLVRLGLPASRVEVLPGGVDTERYSPGAGRGELRRELGLGPGEVLLGSAGRLAPEKGHEDFVQAAGLLARARPGLHFCLAGEGPLGPALRSLARASGLEGRFHFLGWRRDMPAVLADLDLFVLPSRSEGISLALLEAMACGLPIVASRTGGVAEALIPGAGVLVPPGRPEAISAAVAVLLGDPDRRRRMGRLARGVARHRFERRRWLERMSAIYREVARG